MFSTTILLIQMGTKSNAGISATFFFGSQNLQCWICQRKSNISSLKTCIDFQQIINLSEVEILLDRLTDYKDKIKKLD